MKTNWFNLIKDGFGLAGLVFMLLTFITIRKFGYSCWSEPRLYIYIPEVILIIIGIFLIVFSIIKEIKSRKENK